MGKRKWLHRGGRGRVKTGTQLKSLDMKYYNLLFFNQSIDYKYKKYKVIKETKNFVWLQNNQSDNILKVSKKTNRVWLIRDGYTFETAKCNILEEL